MKKKIVSLKDVVVTYLTPFLYPGKKRIWKTVKALEIDSFEVEKGESVCILGDNGAGKSTLLKVIAGIIQPDRGRVKVEGKVRTLFEVGAGFQPESTGLENIFLQGSLFGFSREEIREKISEIERFASLGDYLYAPLKTYSEGMFIRLAFSIAVHTEPDIFLVDDILSVGDIHFQKKCVDKLIEMKEKGITLILVTHSPALAERLCSRAIWLDKGKIISDGEVGEIVKTYVTLSGKEKEREVIERGDLKLVFNQGRVFLFWKDKLLTSLTGGYTTFMKKKEIHVSYHQEWEVERKSDSEIIARGKFFAFPVIQEWKISFLNDYEWLWRIKNFVQRKVEVESFQVGMVWQGNYSKIERPIEIYFPSIRSEEWKEIEQIKDSFPPIFLKSLQDLPSWEIAVYQPVDRIRLFSEGENGEGKAIFWEKREAGDLNLKFRIPEIEKSEAKIVVPKEYISIQWEGKELTGKGGFSAGFAINGKEYLVDLFKREEYVWEEDGKVRFSLKRFPFWIEFSWEKKEGEILWWFFLNNLRPIEISKPRIILNLSPVYSNWFTLEGKGEFSNAPDSFWLSLPSLITPIIGVEGKKVPSLLLRVIYPENLFGVVQKEKDSRILQFFLPSSIKFLPGYHRLFEGVLYIGEKEKIIEIRETERKRKREKKGFFIRKGRLSFVWEEGRGRIFFKEGEITGSWGLYWSIKRKGEWEESFKSLWEVKEINEEMMVIEGKGLEFPYRKSKVILEIK
ncbi:MAG TPA: ABC transporter ATP-binding protein [bacterium]|nr:ABC transporter ATP-binding protein [bacterium]HEX67908.1 ABC transporter ATP-binding protein [bacterium]